MSTNIDHIKLLQNSLHTIRKLKKELQASKETENDPIAIVGMGCKFPGGVNTPEDYWKLLCGAKDAIVDIPKDRWDVNEFYHEDTELPGKMYVRKGGFLQEDIGMFDARFFGISSREAMGIDPQQKLLLETSWEALEYGGIDPISLSGTRTGVFIGATGSEYALLPRTLEGLDGHSATGAAANTISGRLSYLFRVQGPSITLDTACSSALVAVHLACKSLSNNECDLAIAGGVNLLLSPAIFVALCKMNALSPDCSCKTFDENANGYVRAEGCGIVVLKRLSAAQREGNAILAVIKGSAVNHDGQSSGLTVPNGLAQKQLLEQCLQNAGLKSDEIGFIESHGTGTPLGDPIEIKALTDVFAKREPDNPLYIGAVKTNIGHLEAAAGIAGLIKAVLCVSRGKIPANLHLKRINSKIKTAKTNLIFPQETIQWETAGMPRSAGVSSFGFSGTNAHLIISQFLQQEQNHSQIQTDNPLTILSISSQNEETFKAIIQRYIRYLEEKPHTNLDDFCYTLNIGRFHFKERAAIIAENLNHLKEELMLLYQDETSKNIFTGQRISAECKTIFIFDDSIDITFTQGRRLYETIPRFQETFEAADTVVMSYIHESAVDYITLKKDASKNKYMQEICHFLIQYCIAKLFGEWGIIPYAVIGNGRGEITAACIAEIMSLEYALYMLLLSHEITITLANEKKKLQNPKLRYLSGRINTGFQTDFLQEEYWQQLYSMDTVDRSIEQIVKQDIHALINFGFDKKIEAVNVPCINLLDNSDIWFNMLRALAQSYCLGANIKWSIFKNESARNRLQLPGTVFKKKKFWHSSLIQSMTNDESLIEPKYEKNVNPLSGRVIQSPVKTTQVAFHLNSKNFNELKDNNQIVHIGNYLEMLTNAITEKFKISKYSIFNMRFLTALVIEELTAEIMLTFEKDENCKVKFSFFSRNNKNETWGIHAEGEIILGEDWTEPISSSYDRKSIRQRCKNKTDYEEFYNLLQKRGFNLGQSVKWVENVWYGNNEVLAKFRNLNEKDRNIDYGLCIHPGIIDACAQLFALGGASFMEDHMLFMVAALERIRMSRLPVTGSIWCYLQVDENLTFEGFMRGDLILFNDEGLCIGEISGMNVQRIRITEASVKLKERQRNDFKQGDQTLKIIEVLKNKSEAEQEEIVSSYIKKNIASIFRISELEIDFTETLIDLGMDSIIALEIKKIIQRDFNREMALTEILEGPSLLQLKSLLLSFCQGVQKPGWNSNTDKTADLWFVPPSKREIQTKARLFLFHYGIQGASIFKDWLQLLPKTIEICPLQMPGRENRIKEKPIESFYEALPKIEEALLNKMDDLPFIFYGHSMGALLAYRSAYTIWEKTGRKAYMLCVGAYTAPTIYPNPIVKNAVEHFNNLGFDNIPLPSRLGILSAGEQNKLLHSASANPLGRHISEEYTALSLPAMLGDLHIVKSYKHTIDEEIFDIPILAFHGKNDSFVTEDDMKSWSTLTKGKFELQLLEGDHYFLNKEQNEEEVIEIIKSKIENI